MEARRAHPYCNLAWPILHSLPDSSSSNQAVAGCALVTKAYRDDCIGAILNLSLGYWVLFPHN
jgi:hypothetical protein